MKIIETKVNFSSAVREDVDVIMEITTEEAIELKNALAVIEKYKFLAYKAVSYIRDNSDWVMESYRIKDDKVVVKVENGACG